MSEVAEKMARMAITLQQKMSLEDSHADSIEGNLYAQCLEEIIRNAVYRDSTDNVLIIIKYHHGNDDISVEQARAERVSDRLANGGFAVLLNDTKETSAVGNGGWYVLYFRIGLAE